jgi:hypothetical protein
VGVSGGFWFGAISPGVEGEREFPVSQSGGQEQDEEAGDNGTTRGDVYVWVIQAER